MYFYTVPLYQSFTKCLLDKCIVLNGNFIYFTDEEMLSFLMSSPILFKLTAKTCSDILKERRVHRYH